MRNFVRSNLVREQDYGKVEVSKVVALRLARQDEEIDNSLRELCGGLK
jgi:hypothetical protein